MEDACFDWRAKNANFMRSRDALQGRAPVNPGISWRHGRWMRLSPGCLPALSRRSRRPPYTITISRIKYICVSVYARAPLSLP